MNSKTRKPMTEAEQEKAAYRELAKAHALIEKNKEYIPTRYYLPITDAFSEWISDAGKPLVTLLPTTMIAKLLAAGSEEVMKNDGEIETTDRQSLASTDSQVLH